MFGRYKKKFGVWRRKPEEPRRPVWGIPLRTLVIQMHHLDRNLV